MEPRRLTVTVPAHRAGQRVDTVLKGELGLSGTVIRRIKWLPEGILLDGTRVFTSAAVRQGQVLSVLVEDQDGGRIPPVEGPLDLVYEDGDLVVVSKAAGVPTHPGPGHWQDTLGNFLRWHYRQGGQDIGYHPVHRLDKGTTGLMVVAKHPHAQEKLKGQLHTPDFRRVYLALCLGRPAPAAGWIDAPLAPAPDSLIRQEVRPGGLAARTRYETLETRGGLSLVRLELDTGRTHQIRAHMAHLGHPLAGDFLYGTEDQALIPRPALHSAHLELRHPMTGQMLCFDAPLPGDMERAFARGVEAAADGPAHE